MVNYYEKLFELNIKHDLYPAGISNVDFVIQPTLECQGVLNRLNWVYKPKENGGIVIVGKKETTPGVLEPIRKLKEKTAFTFFIAIKNVSLLNKLKPFNEVFDIPQSSSAKLYFDNLINNTINTRPKLSVAEETSKSDIASFFPNEIVWEKHKSDTQKLSVKEFFPGGDFSKDISFTGNTTKVSISLDDGTYLFTESDGSNVKLGSYILIVSARFLRTKNFGVIRIFKDEDTNYSANEAIDYEMTMKKL